MALPFVLGLALGAGAVVAYKNKEKIVDETFKILDKTKEELKDLKEKINSKKNISKKDSTSKQAKQKIEKK